MDALKFAFDTLVVGALALPWLWLFMRIFSQRGNGEQALKFPLIDALSESTRQAVAGVLILAVGYLLGSAVSRISSDFFDDKEILHELPTQSSIRQGVYLHEYCDVHSVLLAREPPAELFELPGGQAAFCKKEGDQLEQEGDQLEQLVAEFFSLQEGKLLLEGEEDWDACTSFMTRLRSFAAPRSMGQSFSPCPGLVCVRCTERGSRRANCESCSSARRTRPPRFACSWACGK